MWFCLRRKQRDEQCYGGSLAPKPTGFSLFGSNAALNSNPLLQQTGLPLFSKIEPHHVQPAILFLLDTTHKEFAELESSIASIEPLHVYAGVINKMELITSPLEYAWSVVEHLMKVKNSDELRKAYDIVYPDVIKMWQAIGQSRPVYRALKSLTSDATAWGSLEEAQRRIVEANLQQMEQSGVGLKGKRLAEFNKIDLELAGLTTEFDNNVLDSTKAFVLVLTRPDEVAGLPATELAMAAQAAVNQGYTNATTEGGPWVITLDQPSYGPAMQHLQNRHLREKLYRACYTIASSGPWDNTLLINQILTLRQQQAKALGYNTYAELSLSTKMARNVANVEKLRELARVAAYSHAKQELQELQAFAQKNGFHGSLELWDVAFWSERQREALFSFKQEDLRPYLPLPNVLQGLFRLCERLFGIRIASADGKAEVWHPDVRFFNIYEDGQHIASFYLDPYSRPENKEGGAWMSSCVGVSEVIPRIPVAYLNCNGSPPVGDVPSLMRFSEVVTLFHETGHGMQHMLTRVKQGGAAGINNIEWDAVEFPSQFMEYWCYDRTTLYGFAKHYATGEPLPEDLYRGLQAQKNYMAGSQLLRQLYFGAVDMELHHQYDPTSPNAPTPFEVMRRLANQYAILPPLPEDRFLCAFGHIFSGGYSAGYYSYLWAEVMSADAFSAFDEVDLNNEIAVRQVGRRFRETVLALGGGRHPADVFRDFRGHDPSPEALLRYSGF